MTIKTLRVPYLTQDFKIICPICDSTYQITLPCPMYMMTAIIDAFNKHHTEICYTDDSYVTDY